MLGHVEEAIAIERRAIDEFERIGHGSGRVTAYFNIAEMLIESGDYEQALEFGSQALALGREINHSLAVGAALETIALARLRREEFAEAAARAEEAAELSLEVGALPRAKRCFELAAEAAENAGEQQRARTFAVRARSLE
jgi:tetratricopeptide (TPR) repeat protein